MQNSEPIKDAVFWCITLLLSLFISYQLYQATTWGAGLSTDSITYLGGARSILENWNLEGLGTHYPPLYFILIALSALITGDTLTALRWLQIVIIALNFIVFTFIVWKSSNRAVVPTIICALLFATSQSVLSIHAMAWSEASFCLFALLGFHFLAIYLEDENNRFSILILSAVCVGLAFVTRFVGVTLIVTGLVALLLYARGNKIKRITDCFYFGFISSVPMLLWMGRNWLLNQEATSRQFTAHLISMARIQAGIDVLLNWLFIPANNSYILLIVLTLLAVLYVLTGRSIRNTSHNRTVEICFLFIFFYIPFLLFSISFFDAHTPLSQRILFPVYLFFMLGFLLLAHRVAETKSIKNVSYILFSLMFILAFAQVGGYKKYLSHANINGIGFASKSWIQSATLQWVEKLPANAIIYTNGPDAITIHTGRASRMVPTLVSPVDRKKNHNIKRDLKLMASNLSKDAGVIVYFNGITWRWYLPTIRQLSQVLPLQVVYRGKDGVVVQMQQSKKVN